ncbi:MAG: hypothetical protein R6W68_12415 [Ignavibacteriaceae bacterium]
MALQTFTIGLLSYFYQIQMFAKENARFINKTPIFLASAKFTS